MGRKQRKAKKRKGHGKRTRACNTDAKVDGQVSEDEQDTQGHGSRRAFTSKASDTEEEEQVPRDGQTAKALEINQNFVGCKNIQSGNYNVLNVTSDSSRLEAYEEYAAEDYQRALDKAETNFIEDLQPDELLDKLRESNFCKYTTLRDIQEKTTTTDKNREILKHIRRSGPEKYEEFKKCLITSERGHLVKVLKEKEREVADEKANLELDQGRRKTATIGAQPVAGQKIQEIHNEEEVLYVDREEKTSCTHNIKGYNVFNTINVNLPASTCNTNSEPNKGKKLDTSMRSFLEAVKDFDDGHYILVAGKTNHVKHIEALSHIPWVAVFDFDPESRTTGLLSYVQEHLNKRQNIRNVSWNVKCSVKENSTLWIFAMGCVEQSDTHVKEDFKSWKTQTKAGIQHHVQQLKVFQQEYTRFTVIVLWPSTADLNKHINHLLHEMEEFSPHIVLATTNEEDATIDDVCKSLRLEDLKVDKITIGLEQITKALTCISTASLQSNDGEFKLPAGDGTTDAGISNKDAKFLNEDLEVLYIDDKTGIKYDLDLIKQEEDTFLKGGTLTWAYWYTTRRIDIERDILERIKKYIVSRHLDLVRSGMVTLYHAPGSGGTTLAQRILWDLHTKTPCAQVKHNTAVSPQDIVDKIEFLSNKTKLPVLILIDGEEEAKVERIERLLGDTCVVILYVKRDTTGGKNKPKNGKFTLSQYVSKKEAMCLGINYLDQTGKDVRKQIKIRCLVDDVNNGTKRMIFDFGLAVHSYEYKVLQPYVEGFLNLDKNALELSPWQTALGYLSLALYYGHTGIPCHFFSKLLGKGDVLKISDFPNDMQEFIVRHEHQGRKNIARISHHMVAKEIIDQLMLWRRSVQRQALPVISNEAKKCIANIALELIKYTGQRSEHETMHVSNIMTSIFISRDSRRVGENYPETPSSKKTKKQTFSQILEDVSSEAPYQERFDIFNQLVTSFPNDPLFQSHLGRLYVHCRPELEGEAEACFRAALSMCQMREEGRPLAEIQYSTKQTLTRVHHMFGNMFLSRAYKSKPSVQTGDKILFWSRAYELLEKVINACEQFQKCREMMTEGMEETYGFIGEIDARLLFCESINPHCGNDVLSYAQSALLSEDAKDKRIAEFIEETFVNLDCLFIDCFMVIDPSKLDSRIRYYQERYATLFKGKSPGYMVIKQDNSTARRFEIAVTKGKYSKVDMPYVGLEVVKNREDIICIVNNYETNIKEAFDSGGELLSSQKRAIDIDLKEWIFAIRTKQFPENYTIEQVLQCVQKWYDNLRTPFSRFYLFVLKSILGFGTESGVNSDLLRQAQLLKEEMLKYSKYIVKPKYPHEWLGKENGIRRLLPGNRFLGRNAALLERSNGNLMDKAKILKGTICYPNEKVAAGFIDIDLSSSHSVPLKAFYVPVRCDMKGKAYAGTRVEFSLAFTMSHGYDAFGVKPLKRLICQACDNRNVEILSCDITAHCPRCKKEVTLDQKVSIAERSS